MALSVPAPFWGINCLCWFAYISAYFGRVNLSIALPYLHDSYGYSNASLGAVASGFFVAYAAGQLINGFLGDHFNPRFFVSIGLALAGLSNILFGFSRHLAFLFLFWTINGYVQSMLWGPLVRVVSDSTPGKYLSRATLFFSSSTIFGYLFSYTLVGRITLVLGWKMAFFIPGVILILAAAVWFVSYKPSPAALSADESAADKNAGTESAASKDIPGKGPAGIKLRVWGLDVFGFLVRTRLWIAALVCMLEGSLKEGLTLWGPTFFSGFQKLPLDRALFLMSLVPLMNCAGLAASGIAYKYFRHQEKRALVLFMSIALALALLLRITAGLNFVLMDIAFFALLAVILATNNILTAFVPLNFKKERRVSAAAGSLDCAVYIGAAASGPLAGFLADTSGWPGIMNGWIGVCAVAVLCAAFSRNYKHS
ncbi:MAG: MFS transporter [Spirochaetaceae bacterium]|nr:MFS transporter [Spirochaetaceae bacterium]